MDLTGTTRSALPLLPLGSAVYLREASLKKGDSQLKELCGLFSLGFAAFTKATDD